MSIPVKAEFLWRAPAEYYFNEGKMPNLSGKKLLQEIEKEAREVLEKNPSLEIFQDTYNVTDCIDFYISGKLIHSGGDLDDVSGKECVELSVLVEGQMEPNNGPGSMRSWNCNEIFDELGQHSDINGDPERFLVKASWVK